MCVAQSYLGSSISLPVLLADYRLMHTNTTLFLNLIAWINTVVLFLAHCPERVHGPLDTHACVHARTLKVQPSEHASPVRTSQRQRRQH